MSRFTVVTLVLRVTVLSALACAALAFAGCASSEPPAEVGDGAAAPGESPDAPPGARIGQPKCPPSLCTSAYVGGHDINELHANGSANEDGVVVDGLWRDLVRYTPDVVGDRLIGLRAGAPNLTGQALVGSYLRLLAPAGKVFRVYIQEVKTTVRFWVGFPGPVETYRLMYIGPGAPEPKPVCPLLSDPAVGDGNTWVEPTHAILFAGDRYNASYQIVAWTDAQAGDWFNVGCAGWWGSKLHLNRHTTAGSDGAHQTTRAQRQDLLSMYVANYCGTGERFTLPNTPVTWASSNGWRSISSFTEYEAVWANGRAVCLDEPRYGGIDPTLRAKIIQTCAAVNVTLPPCSELPGFPDQWQGSGNVLSAIP